MNFDVSDKKSVIIEYLIATLVILSYFTNRYISLAAAVIGFLYIIFEKDEHYSISVLLFSLPFSSVFTISDGTTSLYMFLRVACIFKLLFKNTFPRRYFILLLTFSLYSFLSMALGNTSGMSRIINLILWFILGLAIVTFYDETRMQVWSRSLAQGTIYSCVIGMNLNMIPNLKNTLILSSYLNSNTGTIVSRFSGLWNDPNGLTVFIIVSMFACLMAFNSKKINGVEFYIYEILLTIFGLLTVSKSCMLLLVVFWGYLFFSKSQLDFIQKVSVVIVGVIALYYINNMMSDTISELISRFTSASISGDLTTGRSDLWKMYFDEMDIGTWAFGKGINAGLPNGKAAHNTLIQIIYNIGMIGLLMWVGIFAEQNRLSNLVQINKKRIWLPIFALLSTMFFLDGLFLELFYILIPVLLCTSFRNLKAEVY